jgi:GH24 family phage-related lysozyme (muramidase)
VIQRKHVAWLSICVGLRGRRGGAAHRGLQGSGRHPDDLLRRDEGRGARADLQRRSSARRCSARACSSSAPRSIAACARRCRRSRKAGLTSFAYNVGTDAFCGSTLVRRLNAGDPAACDEMLRWTKAKGITLPGLVKRREQERALCLSCANWHKARSDGSSYGASSPHIGARPARTADTLSGCATPVPAQDVPAAPADVKSKEKGPMPLVLSSQRCLRDESQLRARRPRRLPAS